MLRRTIALCAGFFVVGCATHPSPVPDDLPVYDRQAVVDDLNAFLDGVKNTHPDLTYSADLDAIEQKKEAIIRELPDELNAREAWMAMAVLNPLFKDAHIGLRRPLNLLDAQSDDDTSPPLMTLPVRVPSSDRIEVATASAMLPGVEGGSEIVAINGIDSQTILDALIPRMRGESEALGRLILELRFDVFFWTAFGGFEAYEIAVEQEGRTVLHDLMPGEARIENAPYSVRPLTPDIAYLDVPSFDIAREDEFSAFLPGAFEEIDQMGAITLIIDLRENTGGATDLSDKLMVYLTDEPFAASSTIKARITEANQGLLPGVPLGTVLDVPFAEVVTPPKNLKHRFPWNTVLLIGPLTYSQSIVFTATAIDNDVAIIAGHPTEGPANQTAQVQVIPLENTGFQALAPLYIITRSGGEEGRAVIEPTIPLSAFGDEGLAELVGILRSGN
ncbi:MAG: S41 family peptidase [Pseudomonadota bacterium]